jgi:hypothetical protein
MLRIVLFCSFSELFREVGVSGVSFEAVCSAILRSGCAFAAVMAIANSLGTLGLGNSAFVDLSKVLSWTGKLDVSPKNCSTKAESITTIPIQPLRRDF